MSTEEEAMNAEPIEFEIDPDVAVPGIPRGAEAVLPSALEGLVEDDGGYDEWGFPRRGQRHSELDPHDGWMPDVELASAAVGSDSLDGPKKDWQVNIRLGREQYSALCAAADLYGARPTTFARMLINRGAQATLAAHRAEFLLNPKD